MDTFLDKIHATHRIRDPIYGFIHLTDAELRIVDTPIFQRLRRIHQLALTKYVYPSAEHSRFVHSLGVMHCATLILAGVDANAHSHYTYELGPNFTKTLRFAALLHDIGHLPFSHAVEKDWLQGLSHESLSRYIITNDALIAEIIREAEVEPETVAAILEKKPPAHFKLAHEIISGQLDADRADYLLRDSHCCGVRYGEYDFHRFLQIFAARENSLTGHLSLCVDESDLHVAESLLIARYHYNLQVPFHKTRSGYDCVLRRFMKDFDEYKKPFSISNGRLEHVDLEALTDLDDYTIMERTKAALRDGNPWAPFLLRQKHLVPILDTNSSAGSSAILFKKLVEALRGASEFVEEEDFFVQDDEVQIIKAAGSDELSGDQVGGETPPFAITLVSQEGTGRRKSYVDIADRSWIFEELASKPPHHILRVFVIPEKMSAALTLLDRVEQNLTGEHHAE